MNLEFFVQCKYINEKADSSRLLEKKGIHLLYYLELEIFLSRRS